MASDGVVVSLDDYRPKKPTRPPDAFVTVELWFDGEGFDFERNTHWAASLDRERLKRAVVSTLRDYADRWEGS